MRKTNFRLDLESAIISSILCTLSDNALARTADIILDCAKCPINNMNCTGRCADTILAKLMQENEKADKFIKEGE